jgi:plastocyanin/mono/diheme cytochrome c family protein
MNTSKQVNVMIGLLMVFLVATLLYFLWDNARADQHAREQLEVNTERGAKLYALNCRACHGLAGLGLLERGGLPGVPLNLPENRPESIGELNALQQHFRDTIKCGRVGTLMPPWSIEQGGPLNDFQIEQLVLLITSEASELGWMHAVEEANHGDAFEPAKHLVAAVGAEDTVLRLDDVSGLEEDQELRIGGHPDDFSYELVRVVSVSDATNEIEVERGVAGTRALEHEAGKEVFQGPIPPPEGPIVGDPAAQGFPPCGQKPAAPPTQAITMPVSGTVSASMGDDFFDFDGNINPTLEVNVGDSVTVELTNDGANLHNMRTTGPDGEFDTDDDHVSNPDVVTSGAEAVIVFQFDEPGTFQYRCDFHPVDMRGEITVIE